MLFALLIWLYTLETGGLVGWACCRLVVRSLKFESEPEALRPLPFTIQWLLGFAALTSLASVLSLFMPLGLASQAVVFLLALLAFLTWRKSQRSTSLPALYRDLRSWAPVVLLLALALASLLFLATSKPTNDDTGLYHAQAIRWIETYPAVPGLANIHTRLGYDSSWLLSQALYSFAFLGIQSFHLNTSVLFLVSVLYFALGLGNIWKGSHRLSDWVRTLFFPMVFYILTSEVSSPGTDAPVTLITWIVLAEWLVYWEDGRPARDLRPLILTLLGVYAVTIKLSAFPLALPGLSLLGLTFLRRKWKAPLLAAGLCILVLLPWMTRNVVLTGYLVYPFPAVDLFPVDWKIPADMARFEAAGIQAWARLPRQDQVIVMAMPLLRWAREWFANLTVNRRAILLFTLAAPFGYLILGLWKRVRRFMAGLVKTAWPVYLTAYFGLAFWFFSAPDYRFGTGFIIGCLVLAVAPAILFLQEIWPVSARALPWLVVGALTVFQVLILGSSINPKTLSQRLVVPIDYPLLPTHPCHAVQKTFMVPDEISYGLCYYGVFPCIPSCRNDFEMRGPGLQDGFRHKAPSP